jgi:hypothetical protein
MQDPLVTPDGYLYSREALLENLLQQKKAIKKKLAAYEEQQKEEQQKVRARAWCARVRGACACLLQPVLVLWWVSGRAYALTHSVDTCTIPPPPPPPPPPRIPAQQAAEQAAVQAEAQLIAFDRQNHMGISSKTAAAITEAITAEAATMHESRGARAAVNIKENEEKMKQLRVRRLARARACVCACVCVCVCVCARVRMRVRASRAVLPGPAGVTPMHAAHTRAHARALARLLLCAARPPPRARTRRSGCPARRRPARTCWPSPVAPRTAPRAAPRCGSRTAWRSSLRARPRATRGCMWTP